MLVGDGDPPQGLNSSADTPQKLALQQSPPEVAPQVE